MAAGSWADWKPREFKPTMCTDLIEMMSHGCGAETFNAKYNISRVTFYTWLKAYPDLKLAYDVGKEKAKLYMHNMLAEYAIEDQNPQEPTKKINMAAWNALMKHRFTIPEAREATMQLADAIASPRTQMTVVLDGLRAGLFDTEEAQNLANLIETAQRIGEVSELTARLEAIESAMQSGTKIDDFKEE